MKEKKIQKRIKKREESYHTASQKAWTKERCKELSKSLPKSEKWFFDKLDKAGYSMGDFRLQSNVYCHGKIPDFVSEYLMVIIEVDGSIHDRPDIKENDDKKDKLYRKKGYTVFRIKAYDNLKFFEVLQELKTLSEKRDKHFKTKKMDILTKERKQSKNKKTLTSCHSCSSHGDSFVTYKGKCFRYCKPCKSKLYYK